MSAPGDPPQFFSRPSTGQQHPKSQGNSDPRRGRKKPSALTRPANTSATSESKAKGHPQRSKASGIQSLPLPKSAKKNLAKSGDRHTKKSNFSRNKSGNEPTKALSESIHNPAFEREASSSFLTGQNGTGNGLFPSDKNAGMTINPDTVNSYSQNEIDAIGPVFADPGSLGFMRRDRRSAPRPIPRYMFNQPRLLVPPKFHQDPWDEENQRKMLEIEQSNAGSDYQGTYEEFQRMREVERRRMEELGLVDAENTRKDLSDAIYFQGTCLDMCPIFERTRRSLENNVKALEKDPQTNKISRDRAIKAFSRPAAGQPPPMPSDVRPPHILSSTLDYLIQDILPKLPEAHSFIWDRTRSIRQDFIYQNYYGPAAIDCNEKIVRIHLLSLHVMPGSDVEFSQQQELEQFNKALQTLTEIYQDVRHHGGVCPNEAEFRAYHLISHFRDSELERDLQMLPKSIFQDHMVQLAIVFRTLMSQNNIVERGYKNTIGATNLFVEFFRRVFDPKTPLLLSFLLETHFNEIRFYALKSLTRSYHTKAKPFSGKSLQTMLGFDTIDELVAFVSYYDVDVVHEQGEVLIDLCNKEKLETQYKLSSLQAKPKRSPAHTSRLDNLLHGKTYQELVCAGHSNANLHIKLPKSDMILEGKAKKNSAARFASPAQNSSPFGSTPVATTSSNPASNVVPTLGFGGRVISTGTIAPNATSQFGFQQRPNSSSTNHNLTASSTFKPAQTSNTASISQDPVVSSKPSTSEKKSQQTSDIFQPTANNVPAFAATNMKPTFGLDSKSKGAGNFIASGVNENDKKKEKKKEKIEDTPKVLQHNSGQLPKIQNNPVLAPSVAATVSNVVNPTGPTSSSHSVSKPKAEVSLVDNLKFPRAIEKVYEGLMNNVVNNELTRVLEKLDRKHREDMERQRVVQALSEELYSAFVSEILHEVASQNLAKHFDEERLKRRTIRNLSMTCKKLLESQKKKQQRLDELKSVQFKLPSLKRRNLSGETSLSKRSHNYSYNSALNSDRTDTSVSVIHEPVLHESFVEKQMELERLWAPMVLEPFVTNISKKVKTRSNQLFKCLLFVENWNSPYSKWLNTKFNLRLSEDKTYYKRTIQESHIQVSFESLPKNIKSMQDSFSNAPFIIFESGIFEEKHKSDYSSLSQKLERDCEILQKLVKICDKFSLYKVSVLVIVWDTAQHNVGYDSLVQFFKTRITSEAIESMDVCSMSSDEGDLANTLEDKVMNMSRLFNGLLTERGLRKRKQLETQRRRHVVDLELGPSSLKQAKVRRASEVLQEKEVQALKRAREVQRHSFLSRHASFNRSVDMSNTSAVARTPNSTLANVTLMNLNNSILGNNTFLQSNDVSFLKNHGGAIDTSRTLQEASFSHPPLPKKLQELKDLTASIKAKYVSKKD